MIMPAGDVLKQKRKQIKRLIDNTKKMQQKAMSRREKIKNTQIIHEI